MVVSTMCLHIKVAELNTVSDGKGITGIHSAFLMRHYKDTHFFLNIFKISLGHWVTTTKLTHCWQYGTRHTCKVS